MSASDNQPEGQGDTLPVLFLVDGLAGDDAADEQSLGKELEEELARKDKRVRVHRVTDAKEEALDALDEARCIVIRFRPPGTGEESPQDVREKIDSSAFQLHPISSVAAKVGRQRERLVWLDGEADSRRSEVAKAAGKISEILDRPLTFEEVLREELFLMARGDRIYRSRRENVFARAHESQLVGLAFSGGGIRSATFNLGVLQALAKHGLLRSFHYLSTVSGGSYIGSWFSAWVNRVGLDQVGQVLRREIQQNKKDTEAPLERDWSAITWLRQFSNYLTPQTGLLSLDTWTAIVTYLRNLLLNFSILTLALSALLLLPRFIVQVVLWFRGLETGIDPNILIVLASVFAFVALRSMAEELDRKEKTGHTPLWVVLMVVLPLFGAGILVALWLPIGDLPDWVASSYPLWMLSMGVAYLGFWGLAKLLSGDQRRQTDSAAGDAEEGRSKAAEAPDRVTWWLVMCWALIAGACGGAVMRRLADGLQTLPLDDAVGWIRILTWGPPAVVLIFLLTSVAHIGLIGRGFTEAYRQWWSRLGAWQLILSLAWTSVFLLVFYGPAFLDWLDLVRGTLGVGWLVVTLAGLVAGRSKLTSDRSQRHLIGGVALAAPYVFMLGLVLALSLAAHEMTARIWQVGKPSPAGTTFGEILQREDVIAERSLDDRPWLLGTLIILVGGGAAVLSWRVDVNEFSMHNFYRNRLVRAYLGASRKRRPVRFTGFDADDDLPLSQLAHVQTVPAGTRPRGGSSPGRPIQAPIQILNATLNLTAGEELAWQERKASSFFFTPFHYGFDPGRFGAGLEEAGFRHTPNDGKFTLGTALAISGAAVNPNMGYYSSTALAFLMTVFNSRLGWWLRNPKLPKWAKPGPLFGLGLLLNELRGASGARSDYVNLADGGFFENLGIYELVRRRCRFILACDVEADPKHEFNGLGNAIRRCRSDFGIDIQIQLDPIRRQAEAGYSRWHCAVGRIRYSAADEMAPDGTLVYLKASLTGDEPEDLLNYAARHVGFPHESTANQWFGESQFESYRMLGYHEVSELLRAAGVRELTEAELRDYRELDQLNIESVFVALRRAWHPPSAAEPRSFTRHTEKLVEIYDRLRENDEFSFLDQGLYLDVGAWAGLGPGARAEATREKPAGASVEPASAKAPNAAARGAQSTKELRVGFYLCSSMVQLMENVYLDLDLEHEWAHPDNRGWMNLFRHWASSQIFRQTWAVSAATYGARFQTFCQRQLSLDLGSVRVEEIEWPQPLFEKPSREELKTPLTQLKKSFPVLSSHEIEILKILADRRDIDPGDTLCLLRMFVPTRESPIFNRRRHKYDPATGYEPTPGPKRADLSFVFGVAVLRKDKEDKKCKIRFFRVRNHLRRLGLARGAIERLIVDYKVRDTKLMESRLYDSSRRHELKDLFRSVLNEYFRWKDKLLKDVYSRLRPMSSKPRPVVAKVVSRVERRWRVSAGTVVRLFNSDIQDLELWLERDRGRKARDEEVVEKAARQRSMPVETLERLWDHCRSEAGRQ